MPEHPPINWASVKNKIDVNPLKISACIAQRIMKTL
jgi:hypothetical protein